MLKKILLIGALLSLNLMALDIGDYVPSNTIKLLKMKKNKVYIVDFFASWCHSCEKELPLLVKLQNKIEQSKVELIGVDVDENIAEGKKFQKKIGFKF